MIADLRSAVRMLIKYPGGRATDSSCGVVVLCAGASRDPGQSDGGAEGGVKESD